MTRSRRCDKNPDAATWLIVMGVSGCGKSTVGHRIATHLGWRFLDGDSLHSPANVAKMQAGHPLDDADRWPWLASIGKWIDAHRATAESAVIACSALKRRYRRCLDQTRPGVFFVWLNVSRPELERRLHGRSGHFMPDRLLDSQLATLEPPGSDEPALAIDADGEIHATVRAVLDALKAR